MLKVDMVELMLACMCCYFHSTSYSPWENRTQCILTALISPLISDIVLSSPFLPLSWSLFFVQVVHCVSPFSPVLVVTHLTFGWLKFLLGCLNGTFG